MVLTKEERYARHRAYQATPEAKAKRRAYDKARTQTPEYKERLRARMATPEYKERARLAAKKYRSKPEYKAKKKFYRSQQKHKNKRRDTAFRKTFGISLDDYNALLVRQNNLCAICLQPETFIIRGTTASLAVDHCHNTGRVRGLLCRDCNQGLGKFKDNPDALRRAADYL